MSETNETPPSNPEENYQPTLVRTIGLDYGESTERMGVVVRYMGHYNAYVGVPPNHPLAGRDYDEIPLEVHGGMTYGNPGGEENPLLPGPWYWYGWDYAHYCDTWTFPGSGYTHEGLRCGVWTDEMVETELREVLEQVRVLTLAATATSPSPTSS